MGSTNSSGTVKKALLATQDRWSGGSLATQDKRRVALLATQDREVGGSANNSGQRGSGSAQDKELMANNNSGQIGRRWLC